MSNYRRRLSLARGSSLVRASGAVPPGAAAATGARLGEQVDWRRREEEVRRLRRRIFKAVKDEDLATVRDLQQLAAPRALIIHPSTPSADVTGWPRYGS
jgi:hypothetical protein